jgi:serine/threonine protein kinase
MRYAGQIAYALSYIHGRNGIHRDIKPSNILLAASRTPKLLDFGIMKCLDQTDLTLTNETLGSVPYMSPEQVNGSELTPYADVYSLGVLFFELLTGLRPFTGSDYFIQDAHLKTPPPRPSTLNPAIPPQLDEITVAMLAKNAKDRPSAKDVGDELNRLLVLYDEPPTTRTLRTDLLATKITQEDVNDAEVWLKANGSEDIVLDFSLYLADAELSLEHRIWDRAVRRFGGCLSLLIEHDVLEEAPITWARKRRAKIYTGRGNALMALGRVEEGIANFLIADEAFRWLRLWDSVPHYDPGKLAKLFGNRYGTDKITIVAGLLRMYHSSILNDAFSSKDPL